MYNIEITNPASKFLEKLRTKHQNICDRIENAIDSLQAEPLKGKKLIGELSHMRSLRVGDYRILYTIVAARVVVQIIEIGHRREIYR